MPLIEDEIPAPDGTARGTLARPEGDGPWPGVVLFPDAGGRRPAIIGMAEKIAGTGYVVLVPDVYYRLGDWAPIDVGTAFGEEKERDRVLGYMFSLTNDRIIADARAYIDFLLARPEVRGQAVGTTGYCMGGRMSLIAAGALGSKIGAAASFHGGMIAVDGDETSPHQKAGQISARVYVAGAIEDQSFTKEQAEMLKNALADGDVEHTVEFYPARHGFAVPDHTGMYDESAAQRHYQALEAFYAATL
jgi:carboxymethylenebutenolidase